MPQNLVKAMRLLMAAGNVNVSAATETHVDNSHETHSHSGVASHMSAANEADQTATKAISSMISPDGVTVVSGKDITVVGSNAVGSKSVSLAAKGNVNIPDATETYQDDEFHDIKHLRRYSTMSEELFTAS
ncbi:hemagglutinin repeat-containing protein [Paraburkholderia sp. D15]|uniref:hemagglutinin repeat-containing protein n=1 Tax=Paraburkholderia sp. D15 TaxID=2880218 RepID=UPI002479EC99|nr:hemagglutinin repeat-containing protein [Paraburkholderia sp. D15]WGS49993.1 hemagglutinin repeat-containing protein [Paraburkholderia sp. D15]